MKGLACLLFGLVGLAAAAAYNPLHSQTQLNPFLHFIQKRVFISVCSLRD